MSKPTLAIDIDEVLAQHNASVANWQEAATLLINLNPKTH